MSARTGFNWISPVLVDSTDETKKVNYDLSSITTSTTRTITIPNQNVDLERLYVLPDPTSSTDPVNKNYSDTQMQGPPKTVASGDINLENIDDIANLVYDIDTSLRLVTTTELTNITYSTAITDIATLVSDTTGALSIDGVSAANDDVILVKNQTTLNQNGIYKVAHAGDGSTGWILIKMHPKTQGGDYTNGFVTSAATAGTANSGKKFLLNTTLASLVAAPTVDYATEDQEWEEFTFDTNNSFNDIEVITNWKVTNGFNANPAVSVVKTKTDTGEVFTSTSYNNGGAALGMVLSGTLAGSTLGGVSLSSGDYVLVDQQPTLEENGVYAVGSTGSSWVLSKAIPSNIFVGGSDLVNYRNGMIVEVDSGSGSTFSGNYYILNTPSADLNSSPTVNYVNDGSTIFDGESIPSNTDDFVWELFPENVEPANLEQLTQYYLTNSLSGTNVETKTDSSLSATYSGTNPAKLIPSSNGAIGTIGGATLSTGDQILVSEQSTASENGVYQVLFAGGSNNPYVLGKRHPITAGSDYTNGQYVDINSGTFTGNSYILATSTGSLASPPTVDYATENQTWISYDSDSVSNTNKVASNSVILSKVLVESTNDLELFTGGILATTVFTKTITINSSGLTLNSGDLTLDTGDVAITAGGITTGNNIGVAESNPEGRIHATQTSGDSQLILENQSTTATDQPLITLRRNRTDAVINSGDNLGKISITGNDGTGNIEAATINFDSTGTIATDRVAGIITFSTHPDSTSSLAERVRITETGNVGINETNPQSLLHISNTGGNSELIIESNTTGTSKLSLGDSGDRDIGNIQYNNNNNYMALFTNASERIRINSSGFVGINETNPQSLLHISNTGGNSELIVESSTTGTSKLSLGDSDDRDIGNILYDNNNNDLAITVNASEKIRINTTGLGINETNPNSDFHITQTSGDSQLILENQSTTATDQPLITLRRNRTDAVITFGDNLGKISITGHDGTGNIEAAAINFDSTGTIATDIVAGIITFSTHPDSTSSLTERLRITETGNIGINETNPEGLVHITDPTSNTRFIIENQSTTSTISGRTIYKRNRTDGAVNAGDCIGQILFQGNDGTADVVNASIQVDVPGTSTVATDRVAGNIIFSTHPDSTTNRIERLRIEENGNIGINENSPQSLLHITSTSDTDLIIESSTTGTSKLSLGDSSDRDIGNIQYNNNNNYMALFTNASERVRINNSGNVGINETNPTDFLHITTDSGNTSILLENQETTAGNSSRVFFRRNNGGGVVNSGDEIARLVFQGHDGSSNETAAIIEVDTSGTIATNRVGGVMTFLTHPDSTTSATQRLRIDESGGVKIGDSGNASSSAILEIDSTDRGLLVPRMTDTQRDAITGVNGLIIYSTTQNAFQGYANGGWVQFTTTAAP